MKKLLLPISLIALNVAVIITAEFAGNGTFFETTGLIHLVTALFSVANILVIFRLRYLEGNVAFTIAKGFLAALALFGLGFIAEYIISMSGFGEGTEVFADFIVLMLSAIGFIFILRGFNKVITLNKGKIEGFPIIISGITALVAIIVFESIKYGSSLELQGFILPLALVAFCIPVTIVLFLQSLKIGKKMSVLSRFMSFSRAGFVVFLIAIIFEFFEILGLTLIPELQIKYIAHFMFNAGFTLQLLAFATLFSIGGIYKELDK